MAKVKTKSAAKKRFKKVGSKNGKIKRAHAYHNHLLTKKSPKRKRHLRKAAYVSDADYRSIISLIPY